MSWSSARSGVGTVRREVAHSDDAKQRTHDATRTRPAHTVRWVALASAVLLLAGVGTVAAVVGRGGDSSSHGSTATPGSSEQGDAPTSKEADTPATDSDTGLPLKPTGQDVVYRATSHCAKRSA